MGGHINSFKLIQTDVNTQSIKDEIDSLEDAWFRRTGRQESCFAQAQTNSIPLRGIRRSRIRGRRRRDVLESRYTTISEYFPETVSLIEGFSEVLGGKLGRAKLARLPAGAEVFPHVDRGYYYLNHNRYHLVVDSPDGSTLHAGGETAKMANGELWWFDNKALHSAENKGLHSRIHLIFDVRSDSRDESGAGGYSDPLKLLEQATEIPENSAIKAVGAAVRLYDSIRLNPRRWEELLAEKGCVRSAQLKPITVLTQILWPDLPDSRRNRRASAIAWSLANMDIGVFDISGVERSLRAAGGIRVVDKIWHTAREESLYGFEVQD